MKPLPKIAAIIAFLLAIVGALGAVREPVLAVFSLLPLVAGVGILRARVWSAYGFALIELAQLGLVGLVWWRGANPPDTRVFVAVIVGISLALLFFFAGRALAHSGAKRGNPIPWITVACLLIVPFVFLEAFAMPSGSMENTLLIGDRFVAQVFPRPTLSRGDLIVCHYPLDRRQIFVKRVIGVGGDRIRILKGTVYRNGTALTEPYASHRFGAAGQFANEFPSANISPAAVLPPVNRKAIRDMLEHAVNGELIVPANQYFVLGDNRDDSLDSRYWGFLKAADVIGRPLFIYDSHDGQRLRWNRIFRVL